MDKWFFISTYSLRILIVIKLLEKIRIETSANEMMVIMKNIPSEKPAIPGYNLFFLIGILSVISIIIRRKTKSF